MEKIVRIDQKLKSRIASLCGVEYKEIAVLVFELFGVTVYFNDYGKSAFIEYKKLME
jgi:hypothetical protein